MATFNDTCDCKAPAKGLHVARSSLKFGTEMYHTRQYFYINNHAECQETFCPEIMSIDKQTDETI